MTAPSSIVDVSARPAAAPPVPVPRGATADGEGIIVGAGPVDVEAYIDLASPFCRQFELMAAPTLDRLLADRLISSIRYPMNVLDAAVSAVAYSTRAAAASGGGLRCRRVPRVRPSPVSSTSRPRADPVSPTGSSSNSARQSVPRTPR
jgi:hypothetical protein